MAGSFYSKFWCPGSKGVEAFDHRWDVDHRGNRHLAFINGPFSSMGNILKRVREQRVDCVVIAPVWPRPWQALWAHLPVQATLHLFMPGMFIPGGQVPKHIRNAGPKSPLYAVKAYFIFWRT